MITFMRVDDRIIHGQVITRWAKEYPCDSQRDTFEFQTMTEPYANCNGYGNDKN